MTDHFEALILDTEETSKGSPQAAALAAESDRERRRAAEAEALAERRLTSPGRSGGFGMTPFGTPSRPPSGASSSAAGGLLSNKKVTLKS